MNLRYGYFWNPGVMKRKTIVFPTSTADLRAVPRENDAQHRWKNYYS